jgi:hypothetical protein
VRVHRQDIRQYPETKRRYDRVAADEWTIGQKHCFAVALAGSAPPDVGPMRSVRVKVRPSILVG